MGFLTKGGSGGKHVVEAVMAKLVPRVAALTGFRVLSKPLLQKFVIFFLTAGFKNSLEKAVEDAGKAAKGDPKMTMAKFVDSLVINFVKGAAMGPVGKVIEKFAKNASSSLDEKDRQKIWNLVHKELTKQAKGDDIFIGQIEKNTKALVDKCINDLIAKNFEKVLDTVVSSWKGPMSPAALEKKLREKMLEPANVKSVVTQVTPKAKKELQKVKKKGKK